MPAHIVTVHINLCCYSGATVGVQENPSILLSVLLHFIFYWYYYFKQIKCRWWWWWWWGLGGLTVSERKIPRGISVMCTCFSCRFWWLELAKSDSRPIIMVRLTVDMLLRCSSSHAKRQRDESRKHFLRRLTHLHLENREIDNTVSKAQGWAN